MKIYPSPPFSIFTSVRTIPHINHITKTAPLHLCVSGAVRWSMRMKPHHSPSLSLSLSTPLSPSTTKKDVDNNCLLYTSDAADEEDSVDLGGRRIIKKKKKKKNRNKQRKRKENTKKTNRYKIKHRQKIA
eukprot:TRINITY_DN4212_c0_g1_i19.p2 TRINITY_DN4212_c0_g1~~TRINITY_DN4212_c0_g1_i19.p2  ORF type:complete len:130 (+),score=27.42 TRINITY_DN4212_c0_g1_i19:973-1362(+)